MNNIKEFKTELKALLNKYNASIGFACSSDSDTYGIYDGHIEIEINHTKLRHKHQNYWYLVAEDVNDYIKDE